MKQGSAMQCWNEERQGAANIERMVRVSASLLFSSLVSESGSARPSFRFWFVAFTFELGSY